MVALLILLAAARQDSVAFPEAMYGLYRSENTIIAITGPDRANAFTNEGDVFYQWRDIYVAPDGAIAGAVLARRRMAVIRLPQAQGIYIDYSNLNITGASDLRLADSCQPKGNNKPDAILRIQLGPKNGRGFSPTFTYSEFNADSRGLLGTAKAYRVGTLDDIKVSGTYVLGKTLSFQVNPGEGNTFTGTLGWQGTNYTVAGFRDGTHLYWKATLKETGEVQAEGFAEWDPTKDAFEDEPGAWKATDQLYFQAMGKAFGNPRSMTLQLQM